MTLPTPPSPGGWAIYCPSASHILPTEGRFEPLMQASLATVFRRSGNTSVIVGDEFGDDERLMETTLLEQVELWDGMAALPAVALNA